MLVISISINNHIWHIYFPIRKLFRNSDYRKLMRIDLNLRKFTHTIIINYYSIEFNRNRKSIRKCPIWIVDAIYSIQWCKNWDRRNGHRHQTTDDRASFFMLESHIVWIYFLSKSSGYRRFTISNKFILRVRSHHSFYVSE